ncbi:MAG: Mur ligase domain-containing protein [Flavobacteriaceae bacterium]|nr:Mur ligase domain-containing protein [Flavobacteriaceae bacterium]
MNIHFIAIGGAAMHNLAIALHKKGYQITGSDDTIHNPSKNNLKKYGLLPTEFGWFSHKITPNLNAIVLGMHAKKNNVELLKAQELGITIYSYPEFLYEQSKNKTRVVIGGSHGKTTITAMILHVLNYHNKDVDYMVGAQLEGFETMVKLTDKNEFIILEGDEYLSSPIDLRPKFHLYKPNIALISGIAWDHINVFKTVEIYNKQFAIFIEKITSGGMLVYNQEDTTLHTIVEKTTANIKKYAYKTPAHYIKNGITYLKTNFGNLPLEIFGDHNLQNLAGAKWICQLIGVQEEAFYEAIASFKGASKRLEKIAKKNNTVIFKDFAHSPSKVIATTKSVKKQYKEQTVLACLELHTYSSLNTEFLKEYKNALQFADKAVVFYSPDAVAIKKLKTVSKQQILDAFNQNDLIVYTDPKEFAAFLFAQNLENTIVLLMSSGNYGGLDFESLIKSI